MTTGVLVLVGTPIGNLGDLSPRAVEELARADVVACEDTRRTGRLLAHAGVNARSLIVVNDHNEAGQADEVLRRLARGERVALVSDAGMPAISDPGERLVRAVAEAGFEIEAVPGPSAVVAGLVVSGLPTGRYVFEGFLPRKGRARTERLSELADESRTIVLFEAPHRLTRTLTDLVEVLGAERQVVLARELTKLHEEVWRGRLGEALDRAGEVEPRGEYVIVVAGSPRVAEAGDDVLVEAIRAELDSGITTRDAAVEVAHRFGVARRRVYELAMALGTERDQ